MKRYPVSKFQCKFPSRQLNLFQSQPLLECSQVSQIRAISASSSCKSEILELFPSLEALSAEYSKKISTALIESQKTQTSEIISKLNERFTKIKEAQKEEFSAHRSKQGEIIALLNKFSDKQSEDNSGEKELINSLINKAKFINSGGLKRKPEKTLNTKKKLKKPVIN